MEKLGVFAAFVGVVVLAVLVNLFVAWGVTELLDWAFEFTDKQWRISFVCITAFQILIGYSKR